MVLVHQGKEALVHSFTDHLAARDELGVQLVENVLQVIALNGLFRVEELEELLNELGRHVYFERPDLNRLVNDQLQEELINSLQMRPGGVDLFLLLDTGLRELEIGFLDVRQRPEDVLLDHGHHVIEVRYDQRHDCLLVLEQRLNLVNGIQTLRLAFDIT